MLSCETMIFTALTGAYSGNNLIAIGLFLAYHV